MHVDRHNIQMKIATISGSPIAYQRGAAVMRAICTYDARSTPQIAAFSASVGPDVKPNATNGQMKSAACANVAQAIAAHDSTGYQEALRVLGDAAERDIRIVEGAA